VLRWKEVEEIPFLNEWELNIPSCGIRESYYCPGKQEAGISSPTK